ncbi:DNA recombination protein RmuC [bacterium]|nr:DNA recombination protein RmuC [bacterium]
MIEIIIALVAGICLGIGIFLVLKGNSKKDSEKITQNIETNLRQLLPLMLRESNEYLTELAKEKLQSETKQNRLDLENKRSEIARIVKELEGYLKTAEKERIDSMSALKSAVEESRMITKELSVSTEGLKKVLSNNQLRGQFGEQVADDLLQMAGFVPNVDYYFNKEQAGSETRPDFTILLPDKTKINVDSKFPYNNLQRMTETEDKELKKKFQKEFARDVKEKVKQVTTRDYINPDDKTVDFVILFIPNEMIFSYIYDKMPELWQDAMTKKVIFAGPFSFTAILRMIKQSYENFRVQANIYNIIGHVKAFEKEFNTFSESFLKIGDRIGSLQKQYDTVSTTRFNQLTRRVDKVTQEGMIEDSSEKKKLLDL